MSTLKKSLSDQMPISTIPFWLFSMLGVVLGTLLGTLFCVGVAMMSGCSTPAAKSANRSVEPWSQRPPTGPATERIIDKDGNPNFGPR